MQIQTVKARIGGEKSSSHLRAFAFSYSYCISTPAGKMEKECRQPTNQQRQLAFPRLDSAYLCCRGVHVKDGLQWIAWFASLFCAFSLFILTVSPTESLSQLLLNCSLLSLDLFAILLLFSAHSRESHELLVPFILFEGFNTVGMAVGCIFCLFSLVNSRTEFAEPTDEAERSFANGNFIDDALLMRSGALILSTAFTYAFCSLISLWWTWVAIRCFHYFRGLAAYRANSVGQNEYAESPISTQWTRLAASRPQAILSSTAILSTIDLNIIDSATTNFDDLRHY